MNTETGDTLDETRARFLQDVFFILREPGLPVSTSAGIILNHLRDEVKVLTEILLSIYLRGKNFFVINKPELIERASLDFIEMYLKDEDWVCRSFRNRIYLGMLSAVHGSYKQIQERHEKTEDIHSFQIPNPEKPKQEDTRTVIEDIRELPRGDDIIIKCYKAQSYKKFIFDIASFVPRRVIYDFAKRFRLLYKYTRRKK